MTKNDLKNIVENVQNLVQNYLDKNKGETISSVAGKAGIHPAQLLLFMHGERGLTTKSLSKIGEFLTNNGK